MRQILNRLYSVFLLFIILSCSAEGPEKEQKPEPGVQDTYGYIFVQNDGQLFEIGNKSGEIADFGKISGIEFNVVLNTVTSSGSKFYVYEHEFDPFRGVIHVYDPSTKTSKAHTLRLPVEIFGEDAALVSLEWDETNQNLLALVQENFEVPGLHTSTVARIDPTTFEVTSSGIKLEKSHVSSTVLRGSNLYTSFYRTSTGGVDDFTEINLNSGERRSIERYGFMYAPVHLSADKSSNKVFGFFPYNYEFTGASEPVLIDLSTGSIQMLMHEELTGNLNRFGRSYFNAQTQEHVDLITSPDYHALFQYNMSTGEINTVKIPVPNDRSSSTVIIGAIKKS